MSIGTNEVFLGVILSDGYLRYIRTRTMKSYLTVKQTPKNLGYLKAIKNELSSLGIKSKIKKYTHFLKVTNKNYKGYELSTESSLEFGSERLRWYINEKKIVPKDIKFTSKVIAYWFMGDGGAWTNSLGHSVKISLYTNSFTKEDVTYLLKRLKEKGIEGKITQKNITQPIITISKASEVTKFMDLVKPYILPCFKYKLQYPNVRIPQYGPSRTAKAQKAYYNALPKKVKQERGKIRWDKIKDKRNKERRLKYKNDKKYREVIKLKAKQRYDNNG